jgi:RimJ/RimL family protein N-acetyltransferase
LHVIELRAFVASDGDLIREWIRGPQELLLWAGSAFRWPLDAEQLAEYEAESALSNRQTWTALDPSSDSPVGHASIKLIRPDAARLGRVLIDPDRRGGGWGDALVAAVLREAFVTQVLDRVELGVFAHNTSAVRLYERHGFCSNALLTDVVRVDGTAWDAIQMSLTRTRYDEG